MNSDNIIGLIISSCWIVGGIHGILSESDFGHIFGSTLVFLGIILFGMVIIRAVTKDD